MSTEPLHLTLDEALYAIREEVGPLTRDGDNPHFGSRFPTLPGLVEKVDPIAWKHGVLLHHAINLNVLHHKLWFNGAVEEEYDVELPNPAGTAQGLGSALTYMRRYDYTTSLGLVADLDDDGNAASVPAPAPTVHREPPERPTAPLAARAESIAATHAPSGAVDESF